MNTISCKMIKAFLGVFIIAVLTGCNNSQSAGKVDTKVTANRAAWLAYWDLESGAKDLTRMGKLDKLSYFGAYFDKNDCVFIPKELSKKKIEIQRQKGKYETYLSVVNDKVNPDGSVVLKDIEVLRRLLVNESLMDKHIDDILEQAAQGSYDGIEIDYERIWKDADIGQAFLRFTTKLYAKALKNHLKLRIVLEPCAPFTTAEFPKGPEYIVMFYNLYGLHSDPGPKANKDFIEKTLTGMQALPGEKSAAFSTGGCVWGDNGEKRLITEVEAKTIVATYDLKPTRDTDSQCLVFEYDEIGTGITYQVWYADVNTINCWIAIAKNRGIDNISLWRLGGNVAINKIK